MIRLFDYLRGIILPGMFVSDRVKKKRGIGKLFEKKIGRETKKKICLYKYGGVPTLFLQDQEGMMLKSQLWWMNFLRILIDTKEIRSLYLLTTMEEYVYLGALSPSFHD